MARLICPQLCRTSKTSSGTKQLPSTTNQLPSRSCNHNYSNYDGKPDLRGLRVHQEPQAHKGLWVHEELQAHKDFQVHEGPQAHKDHQVHKVQLGLKGKQRRCRLAVLIGKARCIGFATYTEHRQRMSQIFGWRHAMVATLQLMSGLAQPAQTHMPIPVVAFLGAAGIIAERALHRTSALQTTSVQRPADV